MTEVTLLRDRTSHAELTPQTISDPAEAAQAAISDALAYCAEKMKLLGPQSVLDQLRVADEVAHGYFQYALARRVAGYLGAFDDEVKSVYLYDYEATPEDLNFGATQPISLVHLIVWVRRKTEALNALVAALDRALAECYAVRAGLPKTAHLLDAQVIDDAAVARGAGYGAMLTSVHHQPVLVWER